MAAESRSWMDRLVQRAVPEPADVHLSEPEQVGEGLFVLERRLRHFGAALLPARSFVVRTRTGGLIVISAPPLDDAWPRSLDALGPIRSLVIPNPFHYVYARAFIERYPRAVVHAAPGVRERVPALEKATELGEVAPPEFERALEMAVLGPVGGLSEVVFFHPDSGSLLLTDLAFNMVVYPRAFDRLFWRFSGLPGGFGPGRTTRTLLLRDRDVVKACLSRVLAWPIRQIVVAHGEVVSEDPKAALRRAFRGYLD